MRLVYLFLRVFLGIKLRQNLHPSVQTVVADKNMLLWRNLLASERARLVGVCPPSRIALNQR